jgi:hypothetical protein
MKGTTMKRTPPRLAALLLAPLAEPAASDALATFEKRRHAVLAGALAQPEKLTGGAPMHF